MVVLGDIRLVDDLFQELSGFEQLTFAGTNRNTQLLCDFFVAKTFNGIQIKHSAVSGGQFLEQFKQRFGIHFGGKILLGAKLVFKGRKIRGIPNKIPLLAQMTQRGIDHDPGNPSAQSAIASKLCQIAKHPDKTVLQHVFRFRAIFCETQNDPKHRCAVLLIQRALVRLTSLQYTPNQILVIQLLHEVVVASIGVRCA